MQFHNYELLTMFYQQKTKELIEELIIEKKKEGDYFIERYGGMFLKKLTEGSNQIEE